MASNRRIPVYQPFLNGNEKVYVNECLDSSWISSRGEFIDRLESKFSEILNIENATSVSNGTVAIHLALLALGIGKDDEIIVPTLTYVATVNSIAYVGGVPIFVDAKKDTMNIDVDLIESKITEKTKAILAVHLYGNPCDMEKLIEICNKHNLYLIEDAAEALGTKYKDKYVGSFGDIATFSFFGNKTITTGEGGMVASNNKALIERVAYLKNQSVSLDRQYWHAEVGYNYRMTNICAAIGLGQLEQVNEILEKKKILVHWYKQHLSNTNLNFQVTQEYGVNSFWMVTVTAKDEKSCNLIRDFLSENGVETRPIFVPMHIMPSHKEDNIYPISEELGRTGFNLPSYPGLEEGDVKHICDLINALYLDQPSLL